MLLDSNILRKGNDDQSEWIARRLGMGRWPALQTCPAQGDAREFKK
jgi:hypothetical protein